MRTDPDTRFHLAVYGSLMSGLHEPGRPEIGPGLRYVGPVLIPGSLYLVREGSAVYPALRLDDDAGGDLPPRDRREPPPPPTSPRRGRVVRGELYEVRTAAVLVRLDEWEGHDPDDPAGSPYVRRRVRMVDPDLDAWVYVGNHTRRGASLVAGDWRRFRSRPRP